MNTEIICGLLALAGSLAGTFAGIVVSNNKTVYRIEQLEKKVEKHNNVTERVYKLEQKEAVVDEKIAVVKQRIDDLESFHKG